MVSAQPAVQNRGRPLGSSVSKCTTVSLPEGASIAAPPEGAGAAGRGAGAPGDDGAGADAAGAAGAGADAAGAAGAGCCGAAGAGAAELQARAPTATIDTSPPITYFLSNHLRHM